MDDAGVPDLEVTALSANLRAHLLHPALAALVTDPGDRGKRLLAAFIVDTLGEDRLDGVAASWLEATGDERAALLRAAGAEMLAPVIGATVDGAALRAVAMEIGAVHLESLRARAVRTTCLDADPSADKNQPPGAPPGAGAAPCAPDPDPRTRAAFANEGVADLHLGGTGTPAARSLPLDVAATLEATGRAVFWAWQRQLDRKSVV